RSGKRLEPVGAPGDHSAVGLEPDGKTVAANIGAALNNDSDLWLLDLARGGIATRLTFTSDQAEAGPVWSPDGRRIAFAAGTNRTELYAKPVGGVGEAELLFKSERPLRPSSWSPDGRYVAFNEANPKGVNRILLLPLAGDRKPVAFPAESTFTELDAIFSPDGRWVAYVSTKGSQPDIYIRPFPNGDREWRVSRFGGFYAQWRGDGRELFYLEPTSRALMSVAIWNGERAPPVKLFVLPLIRGAGSGQYSVTADGQRFLIIQPVSLLQSSLSPTPIVMEFNWANTR